MDFIPLHLYSGYSFLSGGILFDKLIPYAKSRNFKYIGLTDLNVMYGYPSFNKACIKNEIKPIFGLDFIYKNNLLTLYIKDETGYKNLCMFSTFLEKTGGICNDFSEFAGNLNNLICVISTKQSELFNFVNERSFKEIKEFKNVFDDFYIGLEVYNLLDKQKTNLIKEFAELYKIPYIAFPHIKYINKEDYMTLAILDAIKQDTKVETIIDEISKDNYFLSDEDIDLLYDYKELKELDDLVNKINFNFAIKRGELLNFTENQTTTSKDLLKELILAGLNEKNIDLKENPKYRNRLNKEFLIIDKMGFCDYFLIVHDYVKYAKDNKIPVGPGRGSVGGSLIAYLLNIIEVDPLKYSDLLFERFLNPERNTMPDIDMDFSDVRRNEVFYYIKQKYGKERTAHVIAFQTIGAKQAIRDAGRVLKIDSKDIEDLSKAIPSNFNSNNYDLKLCAEKIPVFKDLLKNNSIKKLYDSALLIEGFPRQKGLHAAGIIINNKSLLNLMPLTFLDDDTYVTQYEKNYLEEQGFLKMDILGLTALETISNCLNLIKKNENIELEFSKIPYDDPSIFKLINKNLMMGIFQLDTSAASKGINIIKPNCFNEIVDLLALDRPGPMEQIPLYARRKNKQESVKYLDKSLIPILKSTYGIIVYEEQIIRIGTTFAGFSNAEADIFRRAVSKKQKENLIIMKEKFFEGAKKLGHSQKTIEDIYALIYKFASYGFTKAHSIPYSMISCRMAYLKANYPLEFYCSILDSQYGNNDVKFNKYLTEIRKLNIKIMVPNINESDLTFKIYNNGLLLPLTYIGGLPNKIAFSIIKERNLRGKFLSFIDFICRMNLGDEKLTENQISKLIDAGCFDTLTENRASLLASISDAISFANVTSYENGKLFTYNMEFILKDVEEDKKDRLTREYSALGAMISDSPFEHYNVDKELLNKSFESLINNNKYKIFGIIKSIKTITIKSGKHAGEPMAFYSLINALNEEIDLTLFSETYSKYNKLKEDDAVIAFGRIETRNNKLAMLVETIDKIGGNDNE